TREPKIGEVIKPTGPVAPKPSVELMRAGFVMACNMEIDYSHAAAFMLLACHSTATWLGKYDLLLGAGMGFAWRLSLTAALGEERHYYKSAVKKLGRDTVYKKAWKRCDTQYSKTRFVDALDKFLNGDQWPGKNYGGYSWWRFTVNAAEMYNHLISKDPIKALESLNQ